MWRWMAWHGQPVLMEELLFDGLVEATARRRGIESVLVVQPGGDEMMGPFRPHVEAGDGIGAQALDLSRA